MQARWPRSWQDRSLRRRAALATALLVAGVLGTSAALPANGSGMVAPEVGDGPGVSANSVRVVFVGVDLEAVAEITGFYTVPVGDTAAQVEALEDWANANGGVGGRQVEAIYRVYDAATDSPAAEEQLCNRITQDDQAFAVVLTGQFQSNARPCYARRQTLVLDATLVATDQQSYDELYPYLWSPSYPEYDDFVRGHVKALSRTDFFDGRDTVGVVAADTEINRRTIAEVAAPRLRALGIEPEVAWVDTTDQGTLFQGNDQAAVTFRSKRIDRVMFLGGARIAAIFMTVAASQNFTARYAISSFDNPSFLVNNPETVPAAGLEDMVGIGFNPSQEVPDRDLPFPTGPAETECVDIYADAGIEFEVREAARVALPFCDAMRLFKLVGDELEGGDFNAALWGRAADEVGEEFVTATGFGSGIGDGGRAATAAYRPMSFDDACTCFRYESGDVGFPRP